MRILNLALKDLIQILRDKRSLFFLVAMPILFTLFMGFAYQSGMDDQDAAADSRIPLGWVNSDPDGLLSHQLANGFSESDVLRLVELDPELVNVAVQKDEVAGALLIPQDYSDQVIAAALNGTSEAYSPQLTLLADIATPQGQTLYQAVRALVTRTMSSVEIATLSTETLANPADPGEFEKAFTAAAQAWSVTDSAARVNVEMAVAKPEQSWYGDNPYNQASPGVLVQFAIFGLVTSGQILVQERQSRTLQRMVATSLRPWQIIAGHTLAMFVIVFLQEALLIVFGQLVLGVNYGRAPVGILLISIALGLWIAAMGLLIGTLAKEDSQVTLYALMAMFLFSALGGTWFPLETTSGAFAMIGKIMPSAWAMNGYQNILLRRLGSSSMWLPTTILTAYAAAFFLAAVLRFRKMEI